IKKSIESGKESEILEELKGKIVMKPIRFTVYGFRGTSGTYMEMEELSVLDENAIGEEYQKTIEVLK
ncbi:MAG: hypothetical protein M1161_00875, partial [Candidatus Thermoplasmatota archaeon]|nr:hypothetical protein [Candidatus Thermoplasmatota archaeon]